MDERRNSLGIWLFLTFISFIFDISPAMAETTVNPSPIKPLTSAPMTSTVSYDSLRMMARSGQHEQAIKLAHEYLKTHENSSIRILLARMLAWDKQYDAAREQLYFVLSKHPGDFDASDCLADVEVWQGNYPRAIAVISNALKFYPENQKLLEKRELIVARYQVSQGHRDTAIQILQNYLKAHDSADIRNYLDFLSKSDKAPGVTVSTPSAKPASTGPSYDEIKKLSTTDRKKAIQLAEVALKQNDNTDIRLLYASMLSWDSRYNEARSQFEMVLKSKPDSLDAAKGLANVELWSNHKKRALVVVETALKHHPGDKGLLEQRNRALDITGLTPDQLRKLYSAGQPEKAKELAREYLQKNDSVDIRLTLAFMESWDKEYDDAKKQFRLVLSKKPGYADANFGLAKVFIYSDDYISALRSVNAGLRYNPDNKDLVQTKKDIMQRLNEINILGPGLFSPFNAPATVGPYSPGKKMNAIIFNQDFTYVDDLKQIWKVTSLGYERYTPIGPVIFSFLQTDRFNSAGNQVLVEGYPHLFPGSYIYLGYGYSSTSYLPRNYVGFEPFFSLPHGFEFSAGERILQFQGGTTHLYTGSIGKYWGNFWFALRPYYTGKGSRSYYFTTRRYFSSPDSYISVTIGGGKGPNTFDILDPDSISSNLSRTIRLNGDVPLTENLIFTWLVQGSYEHFPNKNVRQETNVDAGFMWRF